VRLDHGLEDVAATAPGEVRRQERVVFRGRLGQAGQQRRLRQVELPHGLVEEHLRGRADAIGGLPADRAVRHIVEVAVKDPGLVVLVVQLLSELGLLDLVGQGVGNVL
jgi:hypothetical protein